MVKMQRLIKLIGFVLIGGYIVVSLFLYLYQYKLIYHPTPHMKTDYPVMVLERPHAEVTVYVLHPGKSHAILYFGGNGDSMAKSAHKIARQFPDFTCYLMDYRGYGASTGEPRESAIYADALALYDKIRPNHQTVSVIGRSLGTGVATYVAAHRSIDKLILVTPFESIEAVAQERYPIFPVKLLLTEKYDSLSRVPKIHAPTLIVMAEQDEVIDRNHTLKLIDAFPRSQVKVSIVKNRGHQDILQDSYYSKVIQQFMNKRYIDGKR